MRDVAADCRAVEPDASYKTSVYKATINGMNLVRVSTNAEILKAPVSQSRFA
jgi:hypothetical protein